MKLADGIKIRIFAALAAAVVLALSGSGCSEDEDAGRVMHLSAGGRVKTMDPALAADLASRNIVAAFYDTLLQYDYTARPYKLTPSMLESMPLVSSDLRTFTFKLRSDLLFQDDACFKDGVKCRRVTAHDVIFSFLRIADARLYSPVFWMFRGKIKGIDDFREATSLLKPGDYSLYEKGIPGLRVIDDRTFVIQLNDPDPRFLFSLAIPYSSIVSGQAVKFYGEAIAGHPVGSGPFRLDKWIRDYRITLSRNPDYRTELFLRAESPADRTRTLPLLDKIVCYQIKQPISAWLMFLQGGLDMSALDKDNLDAVIGEDRQLVPALAKRDIKLLPVPSFEIRYVGFNFTDPLLAENLNLRKAISLAYDTKARVKHFNYQLLPAQGPVPPGVDGYDSDFKNTYCSYDLEKAKELMRLAGYPGGIDPKTGEPLTLTFDLSGNTAVYRQLAELMERDMKQIGIRITPSLNSQPRFFQKLRQGKFQLFLLSWVGDYPDAENFLQLFYGKNAGSCNRVFFRDPVFDSMFEKIIPMPESAERTVLYKKMIEYVAGQCPWIFESIPMTFQLNHSWLENYQPHDFAFNQWKYLSIDTAKRTEMKKSFRPIELKDLRQ
jgi:ABC-type transport system substrate-binding protein